MAGPPGQEGPVSRCKASRAGLYGKTGEVAEKSVNAGCVESPIDGVHIAKVAGRGPAAQLWRQEGVLGPNSPRMNRQSCSVSVAHQWRGRPKPAIDGRYHHGPVGSYAGRVGGDRLHAGCRDHVLIGGLGVARPPKW